MRHIKTHEYVKDYRLVDGRKGDCTFDNFNQVFRYLHVVSE